MLHTHSPYAVAQRPVGCWVEALAMFGLPTGVPVGGCWPRGSDEAIALPAVLVGVVEEAAQAGIEPLDRRPAELPGELRAAALQRSMTCATAGIRAPEHS